MNLIDAYSIKDDELFADEIPSFIGNKCPFGNLENKYAFILTRLNLLNETIKEIHLLYIDNFNKRKQREFIKSDKVLRPIALSLRFASEIKIITDEMISLNYILKYYCEKKNWPVKIKIDCIGEYLNLTNTIGYEPFEKNKATIAYINDIGNAVKHSFINTHILFFRNLENIPKLFAIYHKHNDLKNNFKFYSIKLPVFVNDFNQLLKNYKKHLKDNYSQ